MPDVLTRVPDYPTTVKCKYCDRTTRMTGTHTCVNCWELETRMLADPASARKILDAVEKEAAK